MNMASKSAHEGVGKDAQAWGLVATKRGMIRNMNIVGEGAPGLGTGPAQQYPNPFKIVLQ